MGFFEALGTNKPMAAIQDFQGKEIAMEGAQTENKIKAIEEQKQQLVLNEAKRKEEALEQPVYLDSLEEKFKNEPSKQWDFLKERFSDKFQKDPTTGRTFMKVRDAHNIFTSLTMSETMQSKMMDLAGQDLLIKTHGITKQIVDLEQKKADGQTINEDKLKMLKEQRQKLDDENTKMTKFRQQMSPDRKDQQSAMADDTRQMKMDYDLLAKQAKLEQTQAMMDWKQKMQEAELALKKEGLEMKWEMVKARNDSVNTAYSRLLLDQKNSNINALNSIAKMQDQAVGRQIQALSKGNATEEQKGALNQIGGADNTAMMMALLQRPDVGGKLTEEQKMDIKLKVEFATNAYEQQWNKLTGMSFSTVPSPNDTQSWKYMIKQWSSVPNMTGDAITKKIANTLRCSEADALAFYTKIYNSK